MVREAECSGSHLSPDLIERVCGRLWRRYGLAAVPYSSDARSGLLVATAHPVPAIIIEDEEWQLGINDVGKDTRRLTLSDFSGDRLMPVLLERALMAKLAHDTTFWTLDSNRIWYEAQPFLVKDDISVYRRYRVAALLLEGEGIGISVDVETAFFTTETLAHFFEPGQSKVEQENRKRNFETLTQRQMGQKGTLIYDNGRTRSKCYFAAAPIGITCATTGIIRAKGESYDSLHDYYRAVYPNLDMNSNAPAVQVSFQGISKPQWVAANCLRVRVMNDALPESLNSIDKIKPDQRRQTISKFWARLDPKPLGVVAPGLRTGFWRPADVRVHRFPIPDLVFGGNSRLKGSMEPSFEAYRENYNQRLEYLKESGCYYVPATMPRTLYFAYPCNLDRTACEQLAGDLTKEISDWTRGAGCSIQAAKLIGYHSISEGIEKLRSAGNGGVAIFVLNEEPSAYHEVAFQLEKWRIKRVTERQLRRHVDYLRNGIWNKKRRTKDLSSGRRRWGDFVRLNALDVLQLMDVIPFRFDDQCPHEAQLFIDVGHDRRQFALSLLIARQRTKKPDFRLFTDVQHKTDHQCEHINPKILADQIVKIFEQVLPRRSDPIESLLVLRDGRMCGDELAGIKDAIAKLAANGKLVKEARVDLVDLHKESSNAIRFWEVEKDSGIADNPLEGTALEVNKKLMVLASTGSTTLHQGTAQPLAFFTNAHCSTPVDAAYTTFMATQLNWSSPKVAQRLPLQAKRGDEDLKAREDQEIRRFS